MKTGTICCYCTSKRTTKEALQNHALQVYTNRARLNVCMKWMYFQVKYHNSQNIPTPLYEEALKFINHGCIFKRLQ